MPFTDRIVENPRTFTIQNNPDGTVTLIPAPGTILQEGTPVNATNLNAIEESIATHEEDATTAHGINTKIEKPTSATADRIACFDTNQNKLKDGGKAVADLMMASSTAGLYEIHLNATERTSVEANTSFQKLKESKIGIGGTLRISFELSGGGISINVEGRIYRNGVAVGTLRAHTGNYSTYTEDISGWSADDLIQVYARWVNVGSTSQRVAQVRNLRIKVASPVHLGLAQD